MWADEAVRLRSEEVWEPKREREVPYLAVFATSASSLNMEAMRSREVVIDCSRVGTFDACEGVLRREVEARSRSECDGKERREERQQSEPQGRPLQCMRTFSGKQRKGRALGRIRGDASSQSYLNARSVLQFSLQS